MSSLAWTAWAGHNGSVKVRWPWDEWIYFAIPAWSSTSVTYAICYKCGAGITKYITIHM
jgi:hypothetical protein